MKRGLTLIGNLQEYAGLRIAMTLKALLVIAEA